jgi:hypothetical protein
MTLNCPDDLLRYFVDIAERIGFAYFVTGSAASMQYGEPRTTLDVDIVADINLSHVQAVCDAFPPPEFYLDPATVEHAVLHRDQFNIIHPGSGLKIDVMLTDRDEYNFNRLERRRTLALPDGRMIFYATPEDVIVMKLRFHREGGASKHLNDIRGMLKIAGDTFDYAYLRHWIRYFELEPVWDELLSQGGRTER